ncbi:UNVERIFIED_CONTAM: OVARIAN TUMOR DOMAIN-containing deubiquitinating enzyme 7, partial [Sesamum indicum]
MAKAKHQKPKPSKEPKQPHIKRRGKQADTSDFRAQLDVLGLKIIEVTADVMMNEFDRVSVVCGRALADQLEGNEDEHEKYRNMVVRLIKNNREMFEPFVEDEVPFDEYCRSMGEDGTWAGNMELQAASLVTRSNICIHRHMSPRWYIQNFDKHEARMIHLSYHDGEHYNSVRSKEDTCCGPARPIVIQVLKEVGGDVDAAIEALVAEQGCVDQIVADDELSDSVKVPY